MKNKYCLIVIACMSAALTSCGQKKHAPDGPSDSPSQQARDYLQPFVNIGDSRSNLISKYGTPFIEYTTELHQVSITFMLPASNHAAHAAHAAGFTVFCTSNSVTDWLPVTIQ
ncbi:MAG: hypothetical protein ABSE48_19425 [Verrucomicrobiota bacterium]